MFDAAVTQSIDVAQIVLYIFWVFFFGLVYYLHRENKREGYPKEQIGKVDFLNILFIPPVPAPKHYLMRDGSTVSIPKIDEKEIELKAKPMYAWEGSPIVPTGDPMRDGVGPAAYALRDEEPDHDSEGEPKIGPMREANDFFIEDSSPDPRGMTVYDADNKPAGKVTDLWVDRGELLIRYLEVDVDGGGSVLVPMNFARVSRRGGGRVKVASILAEQFRHVPDHKAPNIVTRREEDKIMAYFSSGHLYAKASRQEPLL